MKVQSKPYGEACCPPVEGTITELELAHADCQTLQGIEDLDGVETWLCKGPSCSSNPVLFKYIWEAKQKIIDADNGNGCIVSFDDRFFPVTVYVMSVQSR